MQKNTDGGRASSDENKLDFPNPKREVQQHYLLVYRDDTRLCPKSVQRCEQCRLAFSSPADFLVVTTVGIRIRTEKSRERKKYSGNIYIHFVGKCLRSYNLNFRFDMVKVPQRTLTRLPNSWKEGLRNKGVQI